MISIPVRICVRHYTDSDNVIKSVDMIEAYGLSTDEKPVRNIANASVFYEMDTRTTFFFDEENGRWL